MAEIIQQYYKLETTKKEEQKEKMLNPKDGYTIQLISLASGITGQTIYRYAKELKENLKNV